jgi:hypothetical protein
VIAFSNQRLPLWMIAVKASGVHFWNWKSPCRFEYQEELSLAIPPPLLEA